MTYYPESRSPKAEVFTRSRSQAIRLPKQFQFTVSKVYVRRQGENLVISLDH